jgi:hypothetical protein
MSLLIVKTLIQKVRENVAEGGNLNRSIEEKIFDLRAFTRKHGISVYHNSEVGVIVLSNNKSVMVSDFTTVCGGLIFDEQFNAIAIPAPSINYNPRQSKVNAKLQSGKYECFEVEDGTSVTIYFHAGKWCIGTAHGFDVTNLSRLDENVTFGDALIQVFSNSGIELEYNEDREDGIDFSKAGFNVNHCYQFGFRHSGFHPFTGLSNKLWLNRVIDVVDIREVSDSFVEEMVPRLKRIELTDAMECFSRDLTCAKISAYALNKEGVGMALENLQSGQKDSPHYGAGFMIVLEGGDVIYFESEFRKMIRERVYRSLKGEADGYEITPDGKNVWYAVTAFLRNDQYFVKLFPQHSHLMTIITKLADGCILETAKFFRQNSRNLKEGLEKYEKTSMIHVVARFFIKKFIKMGDDIGLCSDTASSMIRDYILQVKFAPIFHVAIMKIL